MARLSIALAFLWLFVSFAAGNSIIIQDELVEPTASTNYHGRLPTLTGPIVRNSSYHGHLPTLSHLPREEELLEPTASTNYHGHLPTLTGPIVRASSYHGHLPTLSKQPRELGHTHLTTIVLPPHHSTPTPSHNVHTFTFTVSGTAGLTTITKTRTLDPIPIHPPFDNLVRPVHARGKDLATPPADVKQRDEALGSPI